jgi:hypothetical protein
VRLLGAIGTYPDDAGHGALHHGARTFDVNAIVDEQQQPARPCG